MNHSQANAGALVRAIVDSVDTAVDRIDCTDEDFEAACALLDTFAERRSREALSSRFGQTGKAIVAITTALRVLRAETKS